MIIMAKPIRATPVLRGEDAKKFLKSWIKEIKNPSKGRIALIKEAKKNKMFFNSNL
jgi:hypothetical protein